MECSLCQRTFHKGGHLRRHIRSHTGLKPYACKNCNRSFSRQDSLIRHEKLHTRDATAGVITPDEATGRRAVVSSAPVRGSPSVLASAIWPSTLLLLFTIPHHLPASAERSILRSPLPASVMAPMKAKHPRLHRKTWCRMRTWILSLSGQIRRTFSRP